MSELSNVQPISNEVTGLLIGMFVAAICVTVFVATGGCSAEVEVSSKPTKSDPYPKEMILCDKDANFYVARQWSDTRYDIYYLGTNLTWKVD